jgi:hypothetical protein
MLKVWPAAAEAVWVVSLQRLDALIEHVTAVAPPPTVTVKVLVRLPLFSAKTKRSSSVTAAKNVAEKFVSVVEAPSSPIVKKHEVRFGQALGA